MEDLGHHCMHVLKYCMVQKTAKGKEVVSQAVLYMLHQLYIPLVLQ